MSHENEHSTASSSALELGRVYVCGGLIISVNRSWQVAVAPGQRPAAPFKGMAPLAPWSSTDTTGKQGDVYLAAVAPHDAFWLGFEADQNLCFAVLVNFNGRCALTDRPGYAETLEHKPRNYLVVPDQPWFDSIVGLQGTSEQLIPQFNSEVELTSFAAGGKIDLVIYPVAANAQQPSPVPQQKGPFPLYSLESGATRQVEEAIHPWPGRSLRTDFHPSHPCARLTFYIVEPRRFEALIGVQLPTGLFDDNNATPPPPYDPFRAP